MSDKRMDTKKIVISALLVGLAVVIPYISLPVLPIPEFSVTLFAHVAILIAMFLGVEVSILAALGSVLGFYLKGMPLVVVMRAASHILFLIVGAVLLRKWKDKNWSVYVTGAVTGVIHALCEAVVVAFWFQSSAVSTTFSVGVPIFFLHHCFDYTMAVIIYSALTRARLIKSAVRLPKFRR